MRARVQLDQASVEHLFYAAFELRCGIEARLQQYLDVWDHVPKEKKSEWQVTKLGKTVDQMFRTGDKIIELTFLSRDDGVSLAKYYYTPVTSDLRKSAEKIGNYMHAQKRRVDDDKWWDEFRKFLEQVWASLNVANMGTLLGPPLRHRRTGKVSMKVEAAGLSPKQVLRQVGAEVEIVVRYLDEMPPATEGADM